MVQQVVKELVDYTKYHFSGEEALLEKTNYPALSASSIDNSPSGSRIFSVISALGKGVESIAIAELMNNWLLGHIKETDQQYSAHLNAHGVS